MSLRVGSARLLTPEASPPEPDPVMRLFVGAARLRVPATPKRLFLGSAVLKTAGQSLRLFVGWARLIATSTATSPPVYVRRGGQWQPARMFIRRDGAWVQVFVPGQIVVNPAPFIQVSDFQALPPQETLQRWSFNTAPADLAVERKVETRVVGSSTWVEDVYQPPGGQAGSHTASASDPARVADTEHEARITLSADGFETVVLTAAQYPSLNFRTAPAAPERDNWVSGSTGTSAANGLFGTWRGLAVGIIGDYADNSANTQVNQWNTNPVYAGESYSKAAWQGDVDLAIGAIFADETWAQAAAGDYDDRWTEALQTAETSWAAKPGQMYLRFAHEFNGDWYPWKVVPGQEANFIAAWQRFRALQLTHAPSVKLVFCPNKNTVGSSLNWTACWPGDGNVDVVSVDYYNQFPHVTTLAQWNTEVMRQHADGSPWGLERHRLFALAHGKPFAVSEWNNNGIAPDGADVVLFMEQMNAFFVQHQGVGAGQVLYELLFNDEVIFPQFRLYPNTQQPLNAARYRQLFGQPTGPVLEITVTPFPVPASPAQPNLQQYPFQTNPGLEVTRTSRFRKVGDTTWTSTGAPRVRVDTHTLTFGGAGDGGDLLPGTAYEGESVLSAPGYPSRTLTFTWTTAGVQQPVGRVLSWGLPEDWSTSPTIIDAVVGSNGQALVDFRATTGRGPGDYLVRLPVGTTLNGTFEIFVPADRPDGIRIASIGGHVQTTGTQLAPYKLNCQGATFVHIEGHRLSGTDNRDGIRGDFRKFGSIVQLQNIKVDRVFGNPIEHADVVQIWSGPSILRMDGIHGQTDYQGFILHPRQFGPWGASPTQLGEWPIKNVWIEFLDEESGTAFYSWHDPATSRPLIQAENCYVTSDLDPTLPPNLAIDSSLNPWGPVQRFTRPPGGTVLVGTPGSSYVSPGYATTLLSDSLPTATSLTEAFGWTEVDGSNSSRGALTPDDLFRQTIPTGTNFAGYRASRDLASTNPGVFPRTSVALEYDLRFTSLPGLANNDAKIGPGMVLDAPGTTMGQHATGGSSTDGTKASARLGITGQGFVGLATSTCVSAYLYARQVNGVTIASNTRVGDVYSSGGFGQRILARNPDGSLVAPWSTFRRVRVELVRGTPGVQDGAYRLFLDGVQVLDLDVMWTASGAGTSWSHLITQTFANVAPSAAGTVDVRNLSVRAL